MPLDSLTGTFDLKWNQTKTNSPFASTKQQNAALQLNTGSLSIATYDEIFAVNFPEIAASDDEVVDFGAAFTNFVGESATLTKALLLVVSAVGSDVKFEPDGTNGLTWFFSGTSPAITIPAGGWQAFFQPTAQTIDSTHKRMKFTNVGASDLNLTIALWGGT